MPKDKQTDNLERNSSLIAIRTKKMALPYIGGTACASAITMVDSLVAGVGIGSDALAALAATAPFLVVEQILHCLLGVGIDKLMIQAIGKGNRREADRVFGSVLLAVVAVYIVVIGSLLLFERPILRIMLKDDALIEMVVLYSRPILMASPLFEVFLCIERAFRVDGRARLLSVRGIVTNVFNILLDFLLVTVCHFGLSGLAWASVIGTAVGYTIPLSHFFSKKRTVSPDFSVVFSPSELFSYIKKDIGLGSTATLDEVLEGIAVSTQTGVISRVGGTTGLAIWSVFKTIRDIVCSIGIGASASVASYSGFMYGEKDYDGSRFAVQSGTNIVIMFSIIADITVLVFAGHITSMFRIEAAFHTLCTQCLRIGCAAFLPISVRTVLGAYLPAVNRIRLAGYLVVGQKVLFLFGVVTASFFGLHSVFVCYSLAECAGLLLIALLLLRDRMWFLPKQNPKSICDLSISLDPGSIAAVSRKVREELNDEAFSKSFDGKVALLIEESLNYIVRQNPEDDIRADIKINRHEDGIIFTIVDDGSAYNPLTGLDGPDDARNDELEKTIILGFSSKADYDRALDLNQLTVQIDFPTS